MTTIQVEAPSLRDAVRAAAADWGPAFHSAARSVAAVLVAVYTAGLVAGLRWRRLLAWADQNHHQGIARLGLPGADLDPRRWPSIDLPLLPVADGDLIDAAPYPRWWAEDVERNERAQSLTLPTPTTREACHRLRAQGLGCAAIARRVGISRSAVQRELAG